jgi:hypothetical protein
MRRYRRALKAAQLEQTRRFHDLRHTSARRWPLPGFRCAACTSGWGIANLQTTLIYADYVPNAGEVAMVDRAFSDAPFEPGTPTEALPCATSPTRRQDCHQTLNSASPM